MSPSERTSQQSGHPHGQAPHGPQPAPGVGRRARTNLVALSSVAVLAVYAAGYFRTQSAAQRFVGDTAGRKSRAVPENPALAATAPPHPVPVLNPPLPLPPPPEAKPLADVADTPPVPTLAANAEVAPWIPTAESKPVPAPVSLPPPPPVSASPAPASAPMVAAAASIAASVVAPSENIATGVALETPPATVPAKPAKWRDGKFTGWGSCPHGDIEAIVEIKDGQIISAKVKTCRTAYSCNVIDRVIPQVVIRQSPDIDSVSGSTQSADAFYWGVYSALEEAKITPPPATK